MAGPNDNNSDLKRMQQDAIRRVQEMQSRAQQTVYNSNSTNNPTYLESVPKPIVHNMEPHIRPAASEPPSLQESSQNASHPINPINDIFDGLMKDSERTLILVLLLLLVSEKADTGLIFALMFLII